MGNAISESNALQASAQQLHGKERFAYEQLRMMEMMAAQQLDRYETEARSSASQTPGSSNDNNKVRFERSVRIDASAVSQDSATYSLSNVSFFFFFPPLSR